LESYGEFGALPAIIGVAISDRRASYFTRLGAHRWHQAYRAHLAKDHGSAAECHLAGCGRSVRRAAGSTPGTPPAPSAAEIPPHPGPPPAAGVPSCVLVGCSDDPSVPSNTPPSRLLEFCRGWRASIQFVTRPESGLTDISECGMRRTEIQQKGVPGGSPAKKSPQNREAHL
jgi:hypothetical protein